MNIKSILLELREKINKIDTLILNLLSERNNIATQIAIKKIANNLSIHDQNREKELLHKLTIFSKRKNLSKKYIIKIFKIIIQESVYIQTMITKKKFQNNQYNTCKVSFLGPIGSYSYLATQKYIKKYHKNKSIEEKTCTNFQEVFDSINNQETNYAIVPIENSYSGFIEPIYCLLCNTKLKIIGEFNFPIQHCLLSKIESNLDDIEIIYSHPQPFIQCSNFFKNFTKYTIQYTNSTSEAIKIIANSSKKNVAAIGDAYNTRLYPVQVLLQNISNQTKNFTKFIILSKKTTIIPNIIPTQTTFILKTKKIFLFDIISIFQNININIYIIQAQLCNTGTYQEIIYITVKYHIQSKKIQKLLKILEKNNILTRLLGCYPQL